MIWLKILLLDVLLTADFFGSTLILNRIVESFPEGKFPAAQYMPIWFLLFFILEKRVLVFNYIDSIPMLWVNSSKD